MATKKIVALALSFIMAAVSLGGCTSAPAGNTASASTDSNASAESVESAENAGPAAYAGELPLAPTVTKLKFATHQGTNASIAPPSNDLPIYKKIQELTNVEIEWETVPYDTYGQVMSTRIASGTQLPDVLNLTALGNYEILANDGIIIDQTALIDQYAFYSKLFFEKNPSIKQLMTSTDGKIYAMENTIIDSHLTTNLMVNTYAMNRAGVTKIPDTLDGFYDMLVKMRDSDMNGNGKKDEIPLVLPYGVSGNYEYLNILGNAFGLEATWNPYVYIGDGGKAEPLYGRPEYKEFLTFVKKLYDENLINKDFSSISYDKMIEYVANGQAGVVGYWATYAYLFGAASPDALEAAGGNKDANFEQYPIFVPMDPVKGASGDQYFTKRLGLNGDGMGITADCPEELQPIAMKWIDWLFASPLSLEMQNNGVEGLTYSKDAGGAVTKIVTEGKDWGSSVTEIGGNQPPRAHQQSIEAWRNSWLPQWLDDADAKQTHFYRDPKIVPTKWTVAEEEVYLDIMGDIDTYLSENVIGFITGTKPMNEYDAFLAGLDAIGIPKYIEIFQARYDRQK